MSDDRMAKITLQLAQWEREYGGIANTIRQLTAQGVPDDDVVGSLGEYLIHCIECDETAAESSSEDATYHLGARRPWFRAFRALRDGADAETVRDVLVDAGESFEAASISAAHVNGAWRAFLREYEMFDSGMRDFSQIICSDPECPCVGDERLVPGTSALLYISPAVIRSHKACPP